MPFSGQVVRFIGFFNSGVMALAWSPRWGRLVSGYITSISYVGRKSGRQFTLPIGYRRDGNEVTIPVSMPDQKVWWRNFLGAGAPLSIRLDGTDRTGHAVATRDDRGRVSVAVALDAVP
jgi:hypothetical protein